MIRTKKRMILCIALLAAVLLFIWGNSMADGSQSEAVSGSVTTWFSAFLRFNPETAQKFHYALRKAAHFTEFAALGLLLAWLFGMMGTKKGRLFCLPLLCSFGAACVDETIQIFAEGRSPSLIDVGIDACGAAAGIGLLLIGYYGICKKINRKHLEETT